MTEQLGFSGKLAKIFLQSEITPLLALVGILLGLFAVLITPTEEEPQIDVTFANVFIPFPGASAREVENTVSIPAEQVLSEIQGIDHVYSISNPGMAILTVQFLVGEDRTESIVRLYNKVFSNEDWLPKNMGIGSPIIKPKGIDDVPIVSLSLWSENENKSRTDLMHVAHSLESDLKRIQGTREIFTVGGPKKVVHVLLNPVKLSGYEIDILDLKNALKSVNLSMDVGHIVKDNRQISIEVGTYYTNVEEIKRLVVGVKSGFPIFLEDVADVKLEADVGEQYVWFGTGPAASQKSITSNGRFSAVTLAVAKKSGTNASGIATQIINRLDELKGIIIPDDVNVTITRNYGKTANEKAKTLITKLVFVTAVVVLLVFLTLGWREAIIVGIAIAVTLALTLFASWAWGFTLNRVSLFALIFSIGILVDDAIVVVENAHRHIQMAKVSILEAIPRAVDEVGGPTILATFAVVAALLPMAFVSGLMGPYMSPIPINASMGMVISLFVAFVITPWLILKLLNRKNAHHGEAGHGNSNNKLRKLFSTIFTPFLNKNKGRVSRWILAITVLAVILFSVSLVITKSVVLKMLPFDNKSEFQVIIDTKEGTSLESTAQVTQEISDFISTIPEVTDYQNYIGTAAPINFNGLVRQYYLRNRSNEADIQVNLVDKDLRDRQSHEIVSSIRNEIYSIAKKYNASVKVVEVPPGPPVQSPIVAEVYGADYPGQIKIAQEIKKIMEETQDIVDIDDSVEYPAEEWHIKIDEQKAAVLGLDHQQILSTISTLIKGEDISYLHSENNKYPLPIRIEVKESLKSDIADLMNLKIRSRSNSFIALSEVCQIIKTPVENSIYHKDLLPVVFVTGDLAGELDSPLYGMFDVFEKINEKFSGMEQHLFKQPQSTYQYGIKWDGEWQVTFETFRDMGIAYAVGLIIIYLLVVAQFKSYLMPLIIMAPIPLTIIGVMPGHAIMGAQFTATSMIGMIALAGIIVRNSILLVDFVQQEIVKGMDFQTAVIEAATVRAKPIVLTALAAVLGAFFILDDPIFSGLAIALIFGIFVSTLLTLMLIPIMYYAFYYRRYDKAN